mgnify:CR=1 FL=1
MHDRHIERLAVAAACILGVALIAWWLGRDPTAAFEPSVPGMDDPQGRRATARATAERIRIGEHFTRFAGEPSGNPFAWPWLHGPDYSNISTQDVDLADAWPADGPPVLWSVDLGEGHAAAAVRDGRVYVIDYLEEERRDALRCFSLEDGREIWRRSYDVHVKRNHGMSRTVPAVTEDCVVTIGPRCHVMCTSAEDGAFRWGIDMERELGTTIPGWYTGQCPIVEDGLAILAPAGTNVLMMAVDCQSGAVVWRTPNRNGWQMSHSSIRPMHHGATKMYVYAAIGGLVGVAAEGADRGRVLWESTAWNPSVIAPAPVVLPGGRIFMTAGYGAGSALFEVTAEGDGFSVGLLYSSSPREGLASEQQTPLLYEGHLFGILPKDAGSRREQFACVRPDGTVAWLSGKTHRFGLGPFLLADGKLFILDDDGTLTLARMSTRSFQPLASYRVLEGRDAWGPLAIAGRRLLLRDDTRMICLDVGQGIEPAMTGSTDG